MIVVDQREPRTLISVIQRAVGEENVKLALLETADFAIFDDDGCCLGIERKTIPDFLGSFASGRLVKQLGRLRVQYKPILLLEGIWALTPNMRVKTGLDLNGRVSWRATGWHHAAVQMALLSIQRDGIQLLWTPDHRGTADLLRILHHRAQKGCALVGEHGLLETWPQDQEDKLAIQVPSPRRRRRDAPKAYDRPHVKL